MAKKLTSKKAKMILTDGIVRGKKLSAKQKGFFGLIAGGKKPKTMKAPKKTVKVSKKVVKKAKKK
jgi:hypothetical protein